ncbi:hypothetical protein RJ640_028180 [Escallonia rubra]|uniref:Serine aminopeptidase S33 domain-containing protein n=1 Tax=Escallonia rubra TaxID=112253 RepID=A0AA88QI03_9ASTE|nr:hypothetical protein RJ640_028180 [Escallonia rubra]
MPTTIVAGISTVHCSPFLRREIPPRTAGIFQQKRRFRVSASVTTGQSDASTEVRQQTAHVASNNGGKFEEKWGTDGEVQERQQAPENVEGISLKDCFEQSVDLIRSAGGPPRWFSPLECGSRLSGSPLLLFLPGIDGVGLGLIMQHQRLGKIFDIWCLHTPVRDRTPFTELVKLVEETVRSENGRSPARPIYLVGESLGACLALSVAARNPDVDLVLILANPGDLFLTNPVSFTVATFLCSLKAMRSFDFPDLLHNVLMAATSFSKSQLQPLIAALEIVPDEFNLGLPFLLTSITGSPLGTMITTLAKGLPLQQTIGQISQDVATFATYLSGLADVLPEKTLLWKLKMLKSACAYANSRLHAVKAQTLVLCSGRDQLLPSQDEGERLRHMLPNCDIRYFNDSGHGLLLEDGTDLATIIIGAAFYRRSRYTDYALDYLPPSPSELKKIWASNSCRARKSSHALNKGRSTMEADDRDIQCADSVPSACSVQHSKNSRRVLNRFPVIFYLLIFIHNGLPILMYCSWIEVATDPVMLSTLENGKIVRGLEGIPSGGPVLFVGYHMMLGFELPPMVRRFWTERNIHLRGIAHPLMFVKSEKLTDLAPFDILRIMGAVPVSAANFYRLLSLKSHVLLYPGGMREACHRKGEEYKLFWPEQSEFVRMAARFGAKIVPFGVVGEDDVSELVLDYDDQMKIPYLKNYIEESTEVSVKLRTFMATAAAGASTAQFLHRDLWPTRARKMRLRLFSATARQPATSVCTSTMKARLETDGKPKLHAGSEVGRLTLNDYIEQSKDLMRPDGGPPRWFSPLECGSRLDNSPLLLYLPELVELVETTVRSENGDFPKRPIYLVGDSFGACLALDVAARNPDIDLILILSNPATCFSKSRLQQLMHVFQLVPKQLLSGLPYLLALLTEFNGTLILQHMQIRSQESSARASLNDLLRDHLLPSPAEGERLQRMLLKCEIRVFSDDGHALFLYSMTFRWLEATTSPVTLSTLGNGKIVRGLAGIPSEGPVVFVGYHMLLGRELDLLVNRFWVEGNIHLRSIAHPMMFEKLKKGKFPDLSAFDKLRTMGAVPVSATNFYRLLSLKSHVLLYPGGGEEYKLFWPEQSEFVRMASRFGAKIIPFGSVGEDDIGQLILDYEDQLKIPFLKAFNEEVNKEVMRLRYCFVLSVGYPDPSASRVESVDVLYKGTDSQGEVANQDLHLPVVLPKVPGRFYYYFGKPIETEGRMQELKNKDKALELYLQVKSEVERCIAYLKEKRKNDPYRNILPRSIFRAIHGTISIMAATVPGLPPAFLSSFLHCNMSPSSRKFQLNRKPFLSTPATLRQSAVSTEQEPSASYSTNGRLEKESGTGTTTRTHDDVERFYLSDYFEQSKQLIRSDGGPPRWFSPLECGSRLDNAPLLLFLPGIDGVGLGLILHHQRLGKIFDIWCLHIPLMDRTPYPELVKIVEKTVRSENCRSLNRPIYLVGESFGGCLALDVAARNPDIDLILILANPATCFGKSQLLPLIPVLEIMPEQLLLGLPYVLSLLTAFSTKLVICLLVTASSILTTLCVKLYSGRDQLLPSLEEGERLSHMLPKCELRVFNDSGHAVLLHNAQGSPTVGSGMVYTLQLERRVEDDIDLATTLVAASFYRRSKCIDYVSDYLPPSPSEFKKLQESQRWLEVLTSPVMLSTLGNGKIVRGFAGIPSEGPVLFVGYHMLLGLELGPLVCRFWDEGNIHLRGIAHPMMFFRLREGKMPDLSTFDAQRIMGAVPVSATNFYRLLSLKSHVLLYPGGVREALHRKGEEYKLFWPDQSEFVRMASRFGAKIIPFGTVGEDDICQLLLDYDDQMQIPYLKALTEEITAEVATLRTDSEGEVANQDFYLPAVSPKLPGRFYFFFGKPIETEGRKQELRSRDKAHELYLEVKSEVEKCLAYLKEKRESDPYRSIVSRTVYQATHGFESEVPTFEL